MIPDPGQPLSLDLEYQVEEKYCRRDDSPPLLSSDCRLETLGTNSSKCVRHAEKGSSVRYAEEGSIHRMRVQQL